MKIDREQWVRLSALLDTALDVEAGEREAWLQRLSGDAAALREPLRTLLAQRAHIETDDFLKTPDFAAALRLESARSQTVPLDLQAASEVGAYRLLRELGRGGMGSVWLAERIDGKLKRQVALKFPYAGPNQRQLAERLARERDILASLEHPNIARLYDADVTSLGQPFLVLEYVDGVPINDYCDQHRLTIRERLVLFLQVLNAVQYAHTHLVIHRDLKPPNILITNDRVARLLDFGIAKLIAAGEAKESALTHFGGQALTPDYASPEQISGESVTTACDVYSLGVVLYELLTGSRPYRLKRASRASLEEAIADADTIAPSRANADSELAAQRSATRREITQALRGDLDTIVLKALQKRPAQRYLTADAFAQDIGRYLDRKPVSAQPDSVWYRTARLVARNRIATASAFSIIVVLLVGLSMSIWQAHEARLAQRKADASNRFLVGLFQSAALNNPSGVAASKTTAEQLLALGSAQLLREQSDSPQVRLELLMLLGDLNFEIDLLDQSNKLIDSAIDLARRNYGEHDVRYAAALRKKADIALRLGKFPEAKDWAMRALVALDQTPRRDALLFAHVHQLLGDIHRNLDQPDYRVARQHLETALAIYRSVNYRGEERSIASYNIARTWGDDGDYVRAAEYFRDGLADAERNFGEKSYVAASGYDDYAELMRRTGHLQEAERYIDAAMRAFEFVIGRNHGDYAVALRRKALIEADLGKRQSALAHLKEGIELGRKTFGDVQVANIFALPYASLLAEMGNIEAAQGQLELVLQQHRGDSSSSSSYLSDIAGTQLARILIFKGKLAEAHTLIAAAGDFRPVAPAPVSGKSAFRWQLRRTELAAASGDADNAQRQFNQALATFTAAPDLQSNLPDLLIAAIRLQPDSTQARVFLAKIESRLPQASESNPTEQAAESTAQRYLALGELYRLVGKPREAHKYLEQALQLRQRIDFADSPWLAEVQVSLANCELDMGQNTAAARLFEQAKAIYATHSELGAYLRRPLRALEARLLDASGRKGSVAG